VQTPSNKPSTARIPGTLSSAPTKGISVVPGLAKHTVTPADEAACRTATAPVQAVAEVEAGFVLMDQIVQCGNHVNPVFRDLQTHE
jgi:hypothetical protein